jgi:hypothetical protein
MYTQFWSGNLKGRDHLEDITVDGQIILKNIFKEKEWKGVDRDQRQALVDMVMYL